MGDTDPLEGLPSTIVKETDSFYDLLEVPYNASTEEIKSAYRSKIREYHPDTSDEEYAEDMAFALNRAVETLSSQGERMAYNEMGHKTYHRQRTLASGTTTEGPNDDKTYESSVYDLIRMAKVNTYTADPWWQTVLRSNGFRLAVGVSISLTILFGVLLVI